MSPFEKKKSDACEVANSLVCVGLDPDIDRLPAHLKSKNDGIYEFNREIIENTADLVSAYKLNLAFFEVMGSKGYEILERTLRIIPEGVVVIGDCKRGDMGNSARMYARAIFEHFNFDIATVNPYQGLDAVQPFLDYKNHGVFILCLTSNETAREFQYLSVNGNTLSLEGARAAQSWNALGNAGLVVGATQAEALSGIREVAPNMPLLIPGVGAQGGDLETVIQEGTDSNGRGLLINSSRDILYASTGLDFAEAARQATIELRDKINKLIP